jgi:hypothetical protein
MIALNEVLNQMEQVNRRGFAMPFHIEVVSYNKETGEAGNVKVYENAVLCTSGARISIKKKVSATPQKKKISQNHFINSTRNVELPSGEVKKIHIWLIRQFNGEKVVWNIHG